MASKALFHGLIFDEFGQPAEIAHIGNEACYVVNDAGFLRHIPSEHVDRQVLTAITEQIEGNEDTLTEQATKMLGQDDLFSHAFILNQLKQFDKQLDNLFETGIPETGRAYLGMMGFRVKINLHGDVLGIEQPGIVSDDPD
jgi:hypothetical protein